MYIDAVFYTDTFFGKTIPADELNAFLSRASESIDQLTFNRIVKGGYDALTAYQKKSVGLAVCEQADYLYAISEMPDWVKSYSVGDVSVSRNDKASIKYSPRAVDYLKSTNLLYRGLG